MLACAACEAATSAPLGAQTDGSATLTGAVFRDITREPIAGVSVALADFHLAGETDEHGVFRISGIPPGTHPVVVRRLGFQEVSLKLLFARADTVRQLILLKSVEQLAAITVRERSSDIPGFDERRRRGEGHSLSRAELEKVEHRPLSDALTGIPGLRIARGAANRAWATQGRGSHGGFTPEKADRALGAPRACYSMVYLDGNQVFGGSGPLFDINVLSVSDLEAVEYFNGGANTPPGFRQTGSSCGVLVIWTRRARK